MTNPNEIETADKAATVVQLLSLVSEMRGLRDRAAQKSGRHVTFAEIAHATIAGKGTSSQEFHKFLMELAAILDKNTPQDVDGELAKEWRVALRAWFEQTF